MITMLMLMTGDCDDDYAYDDYYYCGYDDVYDSYDDYEDDDDDDDDDYDDVCIFPEACHTTCNNCSTTGTQLKACPNLGTTQQCYVSDTSN